MGLKVQHIRAARGQGLIINSAAPQWGAGNYRVRDATLATTLRRVGGVRDLNLKGCTNLTDEGLALLQGLRHLTSLTLTRCCHVSDAGLVALTVT